MLLKLHKVIIPRVFVNPKVLYVPFFHLKHELKFLNVYLEYYILSSDKSQLCTYRFACWRTFSCLHTLLLWMLLPSYLGFQFPVHTLESFQRHTPRCGIASWEGCTFSTLIGEGCSSKMVRKWKVEIIIPISEHRKKWFLPLARKTITLGKENQVLPSFFSCSPTIQGILAEWKHHQIHFLMELETHPLLLFSLVTLVSSL